MTSVKNIIISAIHASQGKTSSGFHKFNNDLLTGIQLWASVEDQLDLYFFLVELTYLRYELKQSEDSTGKLESSSFSWSSDLDLSPSMLDSSVVVLNTTGNTRSIF